MALANLGTALQGSQNTGGVTITPPAGPEDFERRKQGFRQFFESPEVQAFALQMGINLLQPRSIAQTAGGQVGQAIGEGANAAGRIEQRGYEREQAALEDRRKERELEIRQEGVDVQREGVGVQREGVVVQKEGLGVEREGIASRENMTKAEIAARERMVAAEQAGATSRAGATIQAQKEIATGREDAAFDTQVLRGTQARELQSERIREARLGGLSGEAAAVQELKYLTQGFIERGMSPLEAADRARALKYSSNQADVYIRGALDTARLMSRGEGVDSETIQAIVGEADQAYGPNRELPPLPGTATAPNAPGIPGVPGAATPEPGAGGNRTGPGGIPEPIAALFNQRGATAVRVVEFQPTSEGFIYNIQASNGSYYVVKATVDNKGTIVNASFASKPPRP